jgi:hypothetical protein
MNSCPLLHESCKTLQKLPLPRRVIDVGHREAFLYVTKGERDEYVTLSHCWQHSQPMLKTTKQTLASHQGRLVWNSLPVIFQE